MTSHKLVNLRRAVQSLEQALADPVEKDRDLGGIVKAFECAYELAWTFVKSHLQAQGHATQGAKDVLRLAWQLGILPGDDVLWFAMIGHRNLTVHTYDQDFAYQLVAIIRRDYTPMLRELLVRTETW